MMNEAQWLKTFTIILKSFVRTKDKNDIITAGE